MSLAYFFKGESNYTYFCGHLLRIAWIIGCQVWPCPTSGSIWGDKLTSDILTSPTSFSDLFEVRRSGTLPSPSPRNLPGSSLPISLTPSQLCWIRGGAGGGVREGRVGQGGSGFVRVRSSRGSGTDGEYLTFGLSMGQKMLMSDQPQVTSLSIQPSLDGPIHSHTPHGLD